MRKVMRVGDDRVRRAVAGGKIGEERAHDRDRSSRLVGQLYRHLAARHTLLDDWHSHSFGSKRKYKSADLGFYAFVSKVSI